METTSNLHHDSANLNDSTPPNQPAGEASSSHEPGQPQSPKPLMGTIRSAMRQAATDAREAADRAVPKVKSAAEDAVYWMAYGVSFAAVFQWHVAKHLAPDCLKAGNRDGVKKGRESAEEWMAKRSQTEEQHSGLTVAVAAASSGQSTGSPA